MRVPFNGNFPTTQTFSDPCCRASYAKFGWIGHNGYDYGLPTGTPVVAANSGTIYSAFDSGAGNYIFVSQPNLETVYMHLSRRDVTTGQTVSEGQQIGLSGNTGNSTGPHLHFGTRPIPYNRNNGFEGYVDPNNYLKKEEPVSPEDQAKLKEAYGAVPHEEKIAVFKDLGITDPVKSPYFSAGQQLPTATNPGSAPNERYALARWSQAYTKLIILPKLGQSNTDYTPVTEQLFKKK